VKYLVVRAKNYQLSIIKYKPAIETKFSDNPKIHLLQALAADPIFSEAHFQLALMYQLESDHKSAENHFLKAIESDSLQILEIEKWGKKLLQKCQFQNAKVLFMKAQDKKYHCSRVNIKLANHYKNQNKLAKAQTCLKNSIDLDPSSSKAHRDLGILLLQQKRNDVARLHIEKALDLDYSDCLSHLNLGMIMKQSKDYVDAEVHFLTALDINPKYSVCMLELAHLQLIMKNKIEAKKYYRKARKISPDINHAELDKVFG